MVGNSLMALMHTILAVARRVENGGMQFKAMGCYLFVLIILIYTML